MTYFFETYGCQMNSAESAALDLVCRERGWSVAADGEGADLVLLNTCSVRETAEQRVMGRIAEYTAVKKRRLSQAKERPLCLVVAGCMAERLGDSLKERCPAVDFVMGTSGRSIFPLILEAAEAAEKSGGGQATWVAKAAWTDKAALNISQLTEKPVFAFSSSHLEEGPDGQPSVRSFVPIMHGCNNFCSYCVVPYVRGREISRDPVSILQEIRFVGERGVREITLLGQNVNTYCWGQLDFPALLRLVADAVKGGPVRWVRFLSANPKDFSSQTIEVMAERPEFCRHLHLPVQHGSNRILGAMNRRYTREQYLSLVRNIRAALPGISLSTDILIGFPGETEEDLDDVFTLMEEVKFLYAYTYHYNPREGTAAYGLPNRIDERVKRDRLARVMDLQEKHTLEWLKSRLGSRDRVLVEGISRKNADELITRTERDEMVVVPG
ncbi:MAG: tRNA (N6-isopentenyl adenosine(37)-C2)-methylthiotransferase MiaB, partial [Treponema sp.]|nr:tRNA (N6-isopentenyl adenosine(37)-C2)-methylthiotransferase MiaB [Treponema sp.]